LSNFIRIKTIVLSKIITPGTYIEENPRFPLSVAEVESAVPAFIGYTEKAIQLINDDLLFVPHRISSLSEFENLFGLSAGTLQFVLHPSIKLFFENGGSDCFILSIGNYNSTFQKTDFIKGLDEVSKKGEPTLLLFPEAVNLPGNDLYDIQKAALKQAADLGDRFCIFDLKFADTKEGHDEVVNEFRNNIGTDNLKYGAVYTPHLKMQGTAIVLPPSAAVAAQYCTVDRNRGVWKAPANVSLSGVNEVIFSINDREQDGLNVDSNAGKSINAIRKFTGKGILIWGARTLAGNDNEWRYVPVRRFFNMVEESVKNACLPFVFEPNDANTWVRIQSMIENYLTLKWREGALAGAKPENAFYVQIGLGSTMTAIDILEGRMIVEIGMAPIRPAEFIILRFSHKMQES
jgi:phage tail sheath protein FI